MSWGVAFLQFMPVCKCVWLPLSKCEQRRRLRRILVHAEQLGVCMSMCASEADRGGCECIVSFFTRV